MGHRPRDWGKIGVYITLAIAAAGAIWKFADIAVSVRNLGEDVKDLKQKSDDLFRSSIESLARIAALEQKESLQDRAPLSNTPTNTQSAQQNGKR
jgi:hypothetical protein